MSSLPTFQVCLTELSHWLPQNSEDMAGLRQALGRLHASCQDDGERAEAASQLADLAAQVGCEFKFSTARALMRTARQLASYHPKVSEVGAQLERLLTLERERGTLAAEQTLARQLISREGRRLMTLLGGRPPEDTAAPDLVHSASRVERQEALACLRQHCPTFCALQPEILNWLGEAEEETHPGNWADKAEVTTHDGQPLPPEWRFFVDPPAPIGRVLSAASSLSGHHAGYSTGRALSVAILVAGLGWGAAAWMLRARGTGWPPEWELVALAIGAGALPGWFAWSWASHVSHELSYVGEKGFFTARSWRSLKRTRRFTLRFAQAARVEKLQTPPVWLWWPDQRGFRQGSRPLYRMAEQDDPHFARAALEAFRKYKLRGHL